MAIERKQVHTYLHPRVDKILTAYCFTKKMAKTAFLHKNIEAFLESLPEADKRYLSDLYEKMTPQERKYPGAF